MNLIGQFHAVPLIFPQDITNSGISSDCISLAKYSHACILLMTGTNTKGCDVTVEKCDNATPDNHPAIAFNYRKMGTSDVWGALTAEDNAGFAIADGDDCAVYAIEVASAELSAAYPFLRISLSSPASGNNFFSALAILTPRYAQDVPETAIA